MTTRRRSPQIERAERRFNQAAQQMFMPPPPQTVAPAQNAARDPQTGPAGSMFMNPLVRQKASGGWRDKVPDLLLGAGIGLLQGDNVGEGLGQGLQYAVQLGQDREQNRRRDELTDMQRQQFEYGMAKDRAATEAGAAEIAQRNRLIDGMTGVSDDVKAWAKANPDFDPFPKAEGPESSLGKLAADLKAGRISQAEYDAAVKKENYIAYPQGPGPTEKERNALSAGLVPGTQEYNDFILGRDVNSAKGPYPSNSPESTDMNNILRGQNDPTFRNSPEFIAAWNRQYEQPKIITTPDPNDPTRMVQMQITMPIPRGFQGPNYGTPTQAPAATPPQGAASAPTAGPPSATAAVVPGTSTIPPKEAADLRKFEAEADAMLSALDTFDKTIEGATQLDFLDALGGGFTEGGRRLSTDWANAALLSKAESLYNLGVLNGPDLDIIRNTLTDPSTIKGQFTSIDAYKTATKSIRKLITDRINTKRSGMNMAPRDDGGDFTVIDGVKIRKKR